jgi:hypothetical protein
MYCKQQLVATAEQATRQEVLSILQVFQVMSDKESQSCELGEKKVMYRKSTLIEIK